MEENNAAVVVDSITKEWLGAVGGVLAILGVIAAPITSGDTAFRSARLIAQIPAYGAKNGGQTSDDLYSHVYRCDRNLII